MSFNFETGKHYTFSSTIPVEFGESFQRVKYSGKVTYDVARLLDNVDIIHRRVYHHLVGAIDNPAAYDYHIFEGANGSRVVLADPWINHTTVEVIDTARVNILVEDINIGDIEIIRQLLIRSGYTSIKMTGD